MNDFSDLLFVVLATAILFAFPVMIFLIYLKRRRQRLKIQAQVEGSIKGTKADLEKAEEALQAMPIDIREALIETHELYDRFQTHRGYSNIYMEALTKAVRDTGLDCELIFQATLPMGVADAVVEPQGVFELYILKGKLTEARKVIPQLIESATAST